MVNTKGLGQCQKQMLRFMAAYPNWHSYRGDAKTTRIARSLEKRGLVELNEYGQFRPVV